MPTITARIADLERMLDATIDPRAFELELGLVKGELKSWTPDEGEARIELNDTNRPDTWTLEGIVRQLLWHRTGEPAVYPFLDEGAPVAGRLEVAPEMETTRPFIGAFAARGPAVTDDVLAALIESQEKLSDTYGKRRLNIATGVYKLGAIAFPVRYDLVQDGEVSFTPLGFDEKMGPARILAEHPKGQEYGYAIEGHGGYPMLRDAAGQVLSMPPIINSREIGEVVVGDEELFVEVTGMVQEQVLLATNIFAANLADRGYAIEAVEIVHPYDTPRGRSLRTPCRLDDTRELDLAIFGRTLGEAIDGDSIRQVLRRYGYVIDERSPERWAFTIPFFRDDLLHDMDVVEDYAISRGYDDFDPVMPSTFTVGGLSPEERRSDALRDRMVGAGFEEIISNVLTNPENLTKSRDGDEAEIVRIANPMVETYSCLRSHILPSLLAVEGASSKALYPHRIFEVGDVARKDEAEILGSKTSLELGALVAHPKANFSEIHGILDGVLRDLGLSDVEVCPGENGAAIPGRCAHVIVEGRTVGWIGEIHPEVLDAWGIKTPSAAFEIDLASLTA